MQVNMNDNFHWRHLKSQRWVQESLDRCLVLFCYLCSHNNGNFSKYDWAMDEILYKEFFADLIESKKIEDSSLWNEKPIKDLASDYTKGKADRKFSKEERLVFYDYLQNFVKFHSKPFFRNSTVYILIMVLGFLLMSISAVLAFKAKQWFEAISDLIVTFGCMAGIVFMVIRKLVLHRKLISKKWQYIFTEINQEFLFYKLFEEMEYVDEKYRYMYEVLEEMIMRKAILIKVNGKYKIVEGKSLADLLNVMDEYYYSDEELFTPQFIAKNILDSKGNPIRARSVSEHRSRKNQVIE